MLPTGCGGAGMMHCMHAKGLKTTEDLCYLHKEDEAGIQGVCRVCINMKTILDFFDLKSYNHCINIQ